jgi:hypothetical protein
MKYIFNWGECHISASEGVIVIEIPEISKHPC